MGIKDTVTTNYMKQSSIFADAFNFYMYGGKQVILPDSLAELDTRQIELPYGGADGALQPVQRTRDIIKSVTAMTDQRTAYLLLAIENQSNIHYALPVKNGLYDMLSYSEQVAAAAASHKLSGDYKNASPDEFLSGFTKSDRLMPVVTLVVYFGAQEWQAPMSLHEMLAIQDAHLLTLVPDYKINLITPASIADCDFNKFHTTLKEVLSFTKYSTDRDKLAKLVSANPAFHTLGRAEINVLNACSNANLSIKEDEEVLDVCIAIEEMKKEAAEIAVKEAREEMCIAIEDMKKEAAEIAVKEAREEMCIAIEDMKKETAREAAEIAARETREETTINVRLNDIRHLIESTGWSVEQSLNILKLSGIERQQMLEVLM